jgi:uncharacterized membrane protein HdeD (DUF308 family)
MTSAAVCKTASEAGEHGRSNVQPQSEITLRPPNELEYLKEHRSWFVLVGIVLIVLGLAAITFPFIAAVALELLLGWIFVIGGIAEILHAFRLRRASGFFMSLLIALITLTVGVLLLVFPLSGVLTLTLVVGLFFTVGGALRIIHAFQWRPLSGWTWLLVGGLLEVLLGILVLSQVPAAAAWILGLLVGIDLAFLGTCLVALAAGVRQAVQAASAPN